MATEVFEVDLSNGAPKTPKGGPPSRLSSSNLTPKAVEERLKIADDYKEKFKKEVEEHKAKREQHAEEVRKRKAEKKDSNGEEAAAENGENGDKKE